MSILIKGALLDGAVTDVYIEKKEIRQVGTDLQVQADQVIDGRRKALIPGFVNAHTHAAMTLFRGFGDDMPLMPWLEQKIWPNEAKLTREDVYWGTKLACLEMIKSGTTTFFDMYHKFRATADAVEEMGLRALLAGVCFDHFKPELAEKSKRENEILDHVTESSPKGLESASRVFFQNIMDISKCRQYQEFFADSDKIEYKKLDLTGHKKVAVPGTTGSYSHIACKQIFSDFEPMFFEDFEDVFS